MSVKDRFAHIGSPDSDDVSSEPARPTLSPGDALDLVDSTERPDDGNSTGRSTADDVADMRARNTEVLFHGAHDFRGVAQNDLDDPRVLFEPDDDADMRRGRGLTHTVGSLLRRPPLPRLRRSWVYGTAFVLASVFAVIALLPGWFLPAALAPSLDLTRSGDTYTQVRDIVSAPWLARTRLASEADPAFLRGMDAAASRFVDGAWGLLSTDEARLGVAAAAIGMELSRSEDEMVGRWTARMDAIPGARDDARGARLRMAALIGMAKIRRERDGLNEQTATLQAAAAGAAAHRGTFTVALTPWSPDTPVALAWLVDQIAATPPDWQTDAFIRGWHTAMAEASGLIRMSVAQWATREQTQGGVRVAAR